MTMTKPIRDELREIICHIGRDCPMKCEDRQIVHCASIDSKLSAIIKAVTKPITEEWLKELQAESAYKLKALPNPLYKFTISGYIGECAKAIRKGLGGK